MPLRIPMVNVEKSTQVKAVGYDADSKILVVEFGGNAFYQYSNVPQEAYDALMGIGDFALADGEIHSVGRAMQTVIKAGGYSYRKLSGDEL